MSLASVTAQQTSALNAAGQAATTPATTPGATARTALSGNFNDFLKLLMTQLKNQDPSNPLDTNQFTTQLAQFASVEQQINANSNLTQLIELTQSQQMLHSSQLVGKQVLVNSDHIALQDGAGAVRFNTTTAQPVAIGIFNDAGVKLRETLVSATPGANEWHWDGKSSAGARLPDGGYRIAVIGTRPDGTTAAVPFTVQGTVTGVQRVGNAVQLQLGATSVEMAKVQSVIDP